MMDYQRGYDDAVARQSVGRRSPRPRKEPKVLAVVEAYLPPYVNLSNWSNFTDLPLVSHKGVPDYIPVTVTITERHE